MLALFLLLPLCACSAGSETALDAVEGFYDTLTGFSARVRAQVQLSDRTQDYILDWTFSGGDYSVTIAEPEALAGIRICGSESGGLTFSYDAVTLAVNAAGSVISPLEALCEILRDWRGSVPDEYCFEQCRDRNALAVSYSRERAGAMFSQRTWFDPSDCAPLQAQVFSDGAMVANFEFLLFQLQ